MICLDTIPVLAGQTVNDARGRYEITIDAAGRHYQQARIEIDGYLTQRKFSINEAFPADRKYTIKDFDWPKSARWQDSRTDINRVLNGVRDVRGDPHRVLNPTVPAQQGQKPAGDPAATAAPAETQPATAGTNTGSTFTSPDRIYLKASQGALEPGKRGNIELAAANPAGNREHLEVELTLDVPEGAAGQHRGRELRPGDEPGPLRDSAGRVQDGGALGRGRERGRVHRRRPRGVRAGERRAA